MSQDFMSMATRWLPVHSGPNGAKASSEDAQQCFHQSTPPYLVFTWWIMLKATTSSQPGLGSYHPQSPRRYTEQSCSRCRQKGILCKQPLFAGETSRRQKASTVGQHHSTTSWFCFKPSCYTISSIHPQPSSYTSHFQPSIYTISSRYTIHPQLTSYTISSLDPSAPQLHHLFPPPPFLQLHYPALCNWRAGSSQPSSYTTSSLVTKISSILISYDLNVVHAFAFVCNNYFYFLVI